MMRGLRNVFLLFFVLLSLSIDAQLGEGIYLKRKKRYEKAEIIFENGSSQIGYIRDFTNYLNKVDNFSAFRSFEKNLGLLPKKIYFRTAKDAKDKKISIDEVKSIIILDDDSDQEIMHLDKLILKTINSSYEAVDKKEVAMLPLVSEGRWSLYGFHVSRGFTNTTYFVPYFRENQSEYAYIGIDFGRLNLFNFQKLEKKLIKAVEASSMKCPQFQNYFNNNLSEFEVSEIDILDLVRHGTESGEKIDNTIENAEMRMMLMEKMKYDNSIKPYIQIQEKYSELCD